MTLWDHFGFVPELYDLYSRSIPDIASAYRYPLRPEIAESLFYLDRTVSKVWNKFRSESTRQGTIEQTAKSMPYTEWQLFGLQMLQSILSECKVQCGYASIANVSKATSDQHFIPHAGSEYEKHDHMPSFFLSETVKYLYLLFQEHEKHWIDRGNFIFTTEGHIFPIDDKIWNVSSTRTFNLSKHHIYRFTELQSFAHSKCLRISDVARFREAIFLDAGGQRSGYLG